MSGDISFASFNLDNFQAAGKKVYRKTVSQTAYNKKRDWTRRMILELDADVIAFQELWSKTCLDDVFNHSALDDYELVYIKDGANATWGGIAVALAVKSPWKVKTKSRIKNFPFKNIYKMDEQDDEDDEVDVKIHRFSRTVINAVLENNNSSNIPDVRVFAAHLKAKLPTNVKKVTAKHRDNIGTALSTIRRTAEAAALRWTLTNSMKGNMPTVVIGDLNDDPRSNTLALITEQPSMTPRSTGGDKALYSSLQLQQLKSFRDVFYTHEFNRLKDTLDHVLVSEEFFESSNRAKWRHKDTRIWNDFVEDGRDETSDHGIIKASFDFL